MYGAVAAGPAGGGYATIDEAARAMARLRPEVYEPIPAPEALRHALPRVRRLHDYFGRGGNDVMKTLRGLRAGRRRQAGRDEI